MEVIPPSQALIKYVRIAEFIMPIHDSTQLEPGDFHGFHQCSVVEIRNALNGGLLPPEYIAMVEQVTGRPIPDVVTLHSPEAEDDPGGIAVAMAPPTVKDRATRSRPWRCPT
jgi:hypothetical protein